MLQGTLNRTIKPNQIKEAFMDVQVWTLFFFVLLNELMNGGIANVRPTISEKMEPTPADPYIVWQAHHQGSRQ